MRERPDPEFFAWSADAARIDAFVAAVSALVSLDGLCSISVKTRGVRKHLWVSETYLSKLIPIARANFTSNSHVESHIPVQLSSGFKADLALESYGAGYYSEKYLHDPIRLRSGLTYICSTKLEVALLGGERSIEVEAAVSSLQFQQDTMDLMLRLCAPDESKRVTTGGCCEAPQWQAPIEIAATYHADGEVMRDLALSWVQLRDGDKIAYAAGLTLDVLTDRVEAAPKGAHVGVAHHAERAYEHYCLDGDSRYMPANPPQSANAIRNGPRALLPGDIPLTREQVLAALATPKETLLEALEAAAVPDEAWRAVELQALEMIEAKKKGAPTYVADITTGKHTRFIERHAPYHVRRLPNGGVMLATHPYRTLWPLWQDALFLLGITA
jgi:hypothetical protein